MWARIAASDRFARSSGFSVPSGSTSRSNRSRKPARAGRVIWSPLRRARVVSPPMRPHVDLCRRRSGGSGDRPLRAISLSLSVARRGGRAPTSGEHGSVRLRERPALAWSRWHLELVVTEAVGVGHVLREVPRAGHSRESSNPVGCRTSAARTRQDRPGCRARRRLAVATPSRLVLRGTPGTRRGARMPLALTRRRPRASGSPAGPGRRGPRAPPGRTGRPGAAKATGR